MESKKIAKRIAEESVVLLKNEDRILPFEDGKSIAFFGRTQIGTLYSGNGSGGANVAGCGTILEKCEEQGIRPEPVLKEFYHSKMAAETVSEEDTFDWTKVSEMVNSGIMYEIFGKYRAPMEEFDVPETMVCQAAEKTDTAVFIIGRNSGGEECDRHLGEDYYLTQSEIILMEEVCHYFANVVIVLNVNGLIDLSWIRKYGSIKGLVFIGIPGEEGAAALAGVLTGKVNPSGKMAVTIAEDFWDYPSAKHFSWNKECMDQILDYEAYGLSAEENGSIGYEKSPVTVYWEDIYAGYRYFDTFGKKVMYPFGYGISYTSFGIRTVSVQKAANGIAVKLEVQNTGDRAGKEVVQIYVSGTGPDAKSLKCRLEHPYQELKGFEKTSLLEPGEREEIIIFIPWKELGVYDEGRAAWIIDVGDYILRVGNSSRNTSAVKLLCVEEAILLEQCANHLNIAECNKGKVQFLTAGDKGANRGIAWDEEDVKELGASALYIRKEDIASWEEAENKGNQQAVEINGVKSAKTKAENSQGAQFLLSEMSVEELASLCVGYGPGTPFASVGDRSDPSTIFDEEGKPLTTNSHPTGYPGYVSPAMVEKGIYSAFYKDGPAGTGPTAWPTEMLLACSFDRKLWRLFGEASGEECKEQQIDVWLAPAVNLHRNPLCGRNFEYFSEDPYLTGVCACEIARGAGSSVMVCPKHFAANEQETFRRGSGKKKIDAVDSILTERAARELYLKPFEMLVKEARIACIMTSFNKINGVFVGGNKGLCTHILREGWGFDGVVVTDWGDMDIVVDGADAVAAGNDVVMPGGPPVIRQILAGYEEGRVTREELERAVSHLMGTLAHIVRGVRK